jgi:hypothetical protein
MLSFHPDSIAGTQLKNHEKENREVASVGKSYAWFKGKAIPSWQVGYAGRSSG